MIDMKPETVLPTIAVQANKHREFVAVQAAIIRKALAQTYLSAGDIDEDIVRDESKQGVKSNGWNTLRALEIIQRAPLSLNVPALGIFGGRMRNPKPAAKGRWCAVYTIKSPSLARAWMERNGQALEPTKRETFVPQEFAL